VPDYEVFVQLRPDQAFTHVGSVRAPSDELALQAAKEAYVRRDKPVGLWVVDREHIVSADPRDRDLFELAGSRAYRQPSYFTRRASDDGA
jgi:ring-1,2-phenylacetyl-CoA epoxidase subunit PaaB